LPRGAGRPAAPDPAAGPDRRHTALRPAESGGTAEGPRPSTNILGWPSRRELILIAI